MPYTILSKACDVYSIETAFLGYDTITKERLTDDEASIRAITGIMSLATLLMGWGQAGGVAEGVVIYMSMAAADSAQVLTTYGLEQLEAPPLVTAIISSTVGAGVGALSFKVGNTYAKAYDAGTGGVFDGIDKDAAFPKYDNRSGKNSTGYKYWKESVDFQGNKVYQRDDLFDPGLITSWKDHGKTVTGTNLERIASGRAPIGYDGKSVNLHHLLQTQDGPIVEVSQSFHNKYYSTIHMNTGQGPSFIDRDAFMQWKSEYWMNRAMDFD